MATVQSVDLNLFRLLDVLYEEQNVSRAAERLFITPSAVSHALRRLRLIFDDELFIRGPRGMAPTPRAHEAARQLRIILPRLTDVLNPPHFEAALTHRVFSVACFPYLASLLVPALAARFAKNAPFSRLDVKFLSNSVVDDLDSGTLDLAIGNFRKIPPRLVAEEILREPYVWVMRHSNPLAGRKLTLGELSKLPHVDILVDGAATHPVDSYDVRQGLERLVIQNNMGATEKAFSDNGLTRNVQCRAPDAVSAMMIVAKTDAACLIPLSAARRLAEPLGLAMSEPPYDSPPLVIQVLYHSEFGLRPAIRWFLDQTRESAQGPDSTWGMLSPDAKPT